MLTATLRPRFRAFFAALVLLAAPLLVSAGAPPTDRSTAYQLNAAHSGVITLPGLHLPYGRRWVVNLGGIVSYPLIAGGRVFVTVADQQSGLRRLEALDLATGAVLWQQELGGTYGRANATYEDGRVYAVNTEGLLQAFHAVSGVPLWSRQLSPSTLFSSPPVAHAGVVYTLGGGASAFLYAVRASDGMPLWSAEAGSGDQCAPAVTDEGVYVNSGGPEVFKLNPENGQLLWKYTTGRSVAGGRTPVYANGRLYVRDFGTRTLVLNAANGTLLNGKLPEAVAPAVDDARYYLRSNDPDGAGRLTAYDVATHHEVWSRVLEVDDTTAPIEVNGVVLLGVGNKLRGYDAVKGVQVWSDNLPDVVWPPDEMHVSHALTGLGAGEGAVLVPAGKYLVAYGPGDLVTRAQLSGPAGNHGWFRGAVQVTLTAYRGSSPVGANIYYQLDGGRERYYAGPFTVASEAIHHLTFWSVDAAGRREPKQTIEIKIDPTAPAPRLRATPSRLPGSHTQVRHVCLHLRGKSTAAALDLESLQYAIDDEYGVYNLTGGFYQGKGGVFMADVYLPSWHEREDWDGRQYTATVTGTDLAGNPFTAMVRINGK